MSMEQAVILAGNPSDGYTIIGPFDSWDEAADFCGNIDAMVTWVMGLDPPRKYLPTVGERA